MTWHLVAEAKNTLSKQKECAHKSTLFNRRTRHEILRNERITTNITYKPLTENVCIIILPRYVLKVLFNIEIYDRLNLRMGTLLKISFDL